MCSACSSGSSLLSTFGLGPGRRGAVPHGRVRQPLLGLPQPHARRAGQRAPDATLSQRLFNAARPRAGAPDRRSASRWSATSRRRSTAGAATPALWKHAERGRDPRRRRRRRRRAARRRRGAGRHARPLQDLRGRRAARGRRPPRARRRACRRSSATCAASSAWSGARWCCGCCCWRCCRSPT